MKAALFYQTHAEAYPGGHLVAKTPPSMEIVFNLLEFFEKKTPKHPRNFAVHIKNFCLRP